MTHTCIICKKNINESKEKWVHLIDYDRKQITGEQFYHLECWKNRFKIDNSARKQKMMKQAMSSIGGMLKNLQQMQKNMPEEEKKEYYEITTKQVMYLYEF